MNLKECYDALGGDYEGVLHRLTSERLVQKFALKFLNDTSFDLLTQSMATKNYDEAFRAAHTIKGICLNLGFTQLFTSSNQLTEALRGAHYENIDALLTQTTLDYQQTVRALRAYQSANS
jgi:HPt (histidine-containing phosphotransfer) domain-containing protein